MYRCSGWDVVSCVSGVSALLRSGAGVSVTPSMRPIRPTIVPTSLPVVFIMYMIWSQCLLYVSLLWLGRGQLCFGC